MPTNNVKSSKGSSNREVQDFVNRHFYDQVYTASWTQDGWTRLRTYLGNTAKGNPKIFTAPFAKGQPISRLLSDWKDHLSVLAETWPSLVNFEDDLAKKVGPTSVQQPIQERLPDVRHYYADILQSAAPVDSSAIKAVIREFSALSGLILRSQERTLELMKKSTSAGNPWFTKKRNVVQDIIPCSVCSWEGSHPGVSMNIQGQQWSGTAVLGWRGQEGGPNVDDVKQRVVWMFPFALNLCELQCYQPLIESAQRLNLVPAWVSNDQVDIEITKLFDTKGEDDLVVCTDFSRFDQHFNKSLQDAAHAILSAILTPSAESRDWLEDVFHAKYRIPLAWYINPDDPEIVTYFEGLHGMASGSGGTNVDETLAHRALQYEVARKNGSRLNPHSQCLGDDGILSYPGITVDDVVNAYESHGQECNKTKQYASTQDCVYLRKWHHKDYRVNGVCVGVYSTCRALGRLRYLERFMDPEYWSVELVALRQLSIIENCKWHPLFHEFIEFCMKRDKYRLGLDIPGFLDNITELAEEATDHMQDFLGYTKTLQGEGPAGIVNWAVVRYLKSKA